MSNELRPCPFCGADDETMLHTEQGDWMIDCDGCFAHGPLCETEDAAIAAWNTRPDSELLEAAKDAYQLTKTLGALNWDGSPNTPAFLRCLYRDAEAVQNRLRAAIAQEDGDG